MMHPYIQEAMVRDRVAALRTSASKRRVGPATKISRHSRDRVGWTLIAIGLRLVSGHREQLSARGVG